MLHQYALLWFVISKPPEHLILVDERELSSRGVHMHLMDQHISDFAVFNHGNTQENESDHHTWEHRGVALIEGVLSNEVPQDAHWNKVLQI